jgi:patatin-like phospholipase/acyl hydrolase
LAIEGGGVRDIIPAVILNKLEQEIQNRSNDPTLVIGDVFDMIAGTGCGAILTCLYLIPQGNKINILPAKC